MGDRETSFMLSSVNCFQRHCPGPGSGPHPELTADIPCWLVLPSSGDERDGRNRRFLRNVGVGIIIVSLETLEAPSQRQCSRGEDSFVDRTMK
jgi:hypothetical protein